jgi:hypothetical protein
MVRTETNGHKDINTGRDTDTDTGTDAGADADADAQTYTQQKVDILRRQGKRYLIIIADRRDLPCALGRLPEEMTT